MFLGYWDKICFFHFIGMLEYFLRSSACIWKAFVIMIKKIKDHELVMPMRLHLQEKICVFESPLSTGELHSHKALQIPESLKGKIDYDICVMLNSMRSLDKLQVWIPVASKVLRI